MTMMYQCAARPCDYRSSLARFLARLAHWQELRHHRRAYRASLAAVPEGLRHDIGLDGGAPLRPRREGGRSFVHDGGLAGRDM
ncbi:MAG: hypothetical protein Q4G25_12145 [Paracoccus sp. (in: a-proteobacteria)]|nr:hypothetical protein [Paracoccus sp. (in: a-proteobacteria)]